MEFMNLKTVTITKKQDELYKLGFTIFKTKCNLLLIFSIGVKILERNKLKTSNICTLLSIKIKLSF